MDKSLVKDLIKSALVGREKAYVPYSKFKVGASVLFENGNIVSGCNIENASYGATNCAERTAIYKGISEGLKEIHGICVVGSFSDFTYPCGICRQVMLEFSINREIPIIIAKSEDEYKIHKLSDILPFDFGSDNLV